MSENIIRRAIGRVIEPLVERRVQQSLREVEEFFTTGTRAYGEHTPYDRHAYNRQEVLGDCLRAWRENPLARRVVELTTQYVVGGGVRLSCEHPPTQAFLEQWWKHRLNRLDTRLYEWCDELTRSGNLFLLCSTDGGGMTYVRALPTADIEGIETAANDLSQETWIIEKARQVGEEPRRWRVWNPEQDPPNAEGAFETVALHFAVNRPVGALWGESDLAPLVRWLRRYASWLENRVRLNYFRQLFLFVVRGQYRSEAERRAREMALNSRPPNPGSILVSGEGEEWGVLSPVLDSFEAGQDGLAVKKMVAVGAGLPLHFLAEPEGTARTTAEAAGGPTYRRFAQRQRYFLSLIEDLARLAIIRRSRADRRIRADVGLTVRGGDLTARDNASLAEAATQVSSAWLALYERGLIDAAEVLRMAYRFAGENDADIERMLAGSEKRTEETSHG